MNSERFPESLRFQNAMSMPNMICRSLLLACVMGQFAVGQPGTAPVDDAQEAQAVMRLDEAASKLSVARRASPDASGTAAQVCAATADFLGHYAELQSLRAARLAALLEGLEQIRNRTATGANDHAEALAELELVRTSAEIARRQVAAVLTDPAGVESTTTAEALRRFEELSQLGGVLKLAIEEDRQRRQMRGLQLSELEEASLSLRWTLWAHRQMAGSASILQLVYQSRSEQLGRREVRKAALEEAEGALAQVKADSRLRQVEQNVPEWRALTASYQTVANRIDAKRIDAEAKRLIKRRR